MKSIDFVTLKKNVNEKLKQPIEQTLTQATADESVISVEALIILPLAVASVLFLVAVAVIKSPLPAFHFSLFIFVSFFLLMLALSGKFWSQEANLANANKLLLGYFLENNNPAQYAEKDAAIKENVFVRSNKPISLEEKIKIYAGSATIAGLRTRLMEYQKGLLISFSFRDSMEHNLYLVSKNMRCDFLKLLQTQQFSYFPNLDKAYNIYSGFRGETAFFIDTNEHIFKQIADLVTQNIILAFLGDEIYLYYENFDLGVFTNHNRHIDLEGKNFENSYYQLQQIQQILQLLSKVQ